MKTTNIEPLLDLIPEMAEGPNPVILIEKKEEDQKNNISDISDISSSNSLDQMTREVIENVTMGVIND